MGECLFLDRNNSWPDRSACLARAGRNAGLAFISGPARLVEKPVTAPKGSRRGAFDGGGDPPCKLLFPKDYHRAKPPLKHRRAIVETGPRRPVLSDGASTAIRQDLARTCAGLFLRGPANPGAMADAGKDDEANQGRHSRRRSAKNRRNSLGLMSRASRFWVKSAAAEAIDAFCKGGVLLKRLPANDRRKAGA